MRSQIYAAAIAILISTAALAADDPGGWSKAKWGMTEQELLKAFDGKLTRFEVVDKNQKAKLGFDALDVAGTDFTVYLSPDDHGRLDHVLFTPTSPTDSTDVTFQRLENLLVEKYGRPWKTEEHGQTQLQWTFKTTVITLSLDSLPRLPGMRQPWILTLLYKMRVDNPL